MTGLGGKGVMGGWEKTGRTRGEGRKKWMNEWSHEKRTGHPPGYFWKLKSKSQKQKTSKREKRERSGKGGKKNAVESPKERRDGYSP